MPDSTPRPTAAATPTLTPEPSHRPSTRGRSSLGRWLGLAAVALAVPLAITLGRAGLDTSRELLAISAGASWAAMAAGLVGGLALGLGGGAVRGFRRGLVLGMALALTAAGVSLGYGLIVGPAPAVAGCAALPRAASSATVDGRATIDGVEAGRLSAAEADPSTVTALLARLAQVPFEDHGIERLRGAEARRCSVYIDGDAALAAMPPLSGLIDAAHAAQGLPDWRGELAWWKAPDGQLVGARVTVGGHPGDAWSEVGLRGRLTGELRLARAELP